MALHCPYFWYEIPLAYHFLPLIYTFAVCLIVAVALAAVTFQGIRLMRTNPVDALKKE